MYTFSKHAHRNSDTEYHPSTFSLRVTGFKKCPSTSRKRHSQLNVHGSSQSSTSSALEQGGKHVGAKTTSILIKAYYYLLFCLNTATESFPPVMTPCGTWIGPVEPRCTDRTEVQHGCRKQLPCWYLRHCSSHVGADRHVP